MSHRPVALAFACALAACGSDGAEPDLGGLPADDAAAPANLATTLSAQTTIRVHYPAGTHALALRGSSSPLSWTQGVALAAGADDTYTYVFATEPAAPVEFKPLVDDSTWSRGANYHVAPGATVDVYPHFVAAHGQVVKLLPAFHSALLGNDRVVWAYLPPSYDENPRARYPVVYMHDGQNLFDPALAFGGNEWKVDETIDSAVEGATATIAELIVIGPENAGAQRMAEYTPVKDPGYADGGGGETYVRMLVEELKPVVDGMLRTRPERATTGVLGSSLGGLISSYAGLTKPDVFGVMGAMSPSTWWDGNWIVGQVAGMGALRPDRVYVDCGNPGDDYPNTVQLVAAYLGAGYVEGANFLHVYQSGGQHNEVYWAERLPAALAFLFPAR